MTSNFFGLTDVGKVRGNNEDTFIAQTTKDGRYILAAAIDGVGGYSGGEIAAAIARDSIVEYFDKSGSDINMMMRQALMNANEKIYQEKIEVKEHDSMACVLTLAVVDLKNNEFHYIHVGDTRLYLLRDGSLVKLTKDQSFVGFLEDSGRLTEEAAMSHPKRNEINKALGFNTGLENEGDYFEAGISPFLPGDTILLCSDGLTDMVNKKDITDIITQGKSLEEMAKQLIEAANSRGGKDNITAVLVNNNKEIQKQEPVKPIQESKKKVQNNEKLVSEPIVESQATAPSLISEKRSKHWLVPLLAIISGALSIAMIYLLFFREQVVPAVEEKAPPHAPVQTDSEQMFYRLLNANRGDTLILSDSVFAKPIVLTKTVDINTDTLYILSRGKIIFKNDSLFQGPAFRIPAGMKNIVLNGMVVDGFQVGIESQTRNLRLEGIQFLDCPVPVRYQFSNTPDNFMNGSLTDIFFKPDTTTQTIKK